MQMTVRLVKLVKSKRSQYLYNPVEYTILKEKFMETMIYIHEYCITIHPSIHSLQFAGPEAKHFVLGRVLQKQPQKLFQELNIKL